jgi:hypothetical protein
MYLNQETINLQSQLADYCRSGVYTPIKGVNSNRVENYRRLVYNNVKNTLEKAYPITLAWLNKEEWEKLVYSYFKLHNSKTPKIWEMPREFMEFVRENKFAVSLDKPALDDLLLMEWIEIEVYCMPDIFIDTGNKSGDNIYDILILSPEYRLMKLDYPVHLLHADKAKEKKGNWFLYVFRNQETGSVQFLNVSMLHVYVLEKQYESPQSIFELLPEISSVFGIADVKQIKDHLCIFVSDLISKGAVIGYRSTKK